MKFKNNTPKPREGPRASLRIIFLKCENINETQFYNDIIYTPKYLQ